jgi:hypothetical protein
MIQANKSQGGDRLLRIREKSKRMKEVFFEFSSNAEC